MIKMQIAGLIIGALVIFLGTYVYFNVDTKVSEQPSDIQSQASTTGTLSVASSTETVASEEDSTNTKVEPALRALDVKPWEWVSATYADNRVVTPNKEGDFTMTFGSGGGVSFDTDCNSMSSSYEAYSGGLTFAPIASTKMYCEGSKETEFAALVASTKTYRFTDRGELVLETENGDTILFK